MTKHPRRGRAAHTVLCPFSRDWCVDRFFDSLAASDVPFADCRFIAYVDHDSEALAEHVTERAMQLPFAAVTVRLTGEAPPDDTAGTRHRRRRQAIMRQETVKLVPKATDKLLLLEDDTTVPANAWERLSCMLAYGFDWASGFEVGRWNKPCAGIWRIGNGHLTSMMPTDGVEECDATGVYLVMTRPEVYAARPWDVYDNRWGQDVSVTWLMKQDGYKLGVDWTLQCVHMAPTEDWTCDQVVEYDRKLDGFEPMHFSQMPEYRPEPVKRLKLGIPVTFQGRDYAKGSLVEMPTLYAMKDAGLIVGDKLPPR